MFERTLWGITLRLREEESVLIQIERERKKLLKYFICTWFSVKEKKRKVFLFFLLTGFNGTIMYIYRNIPHYSS